MSSIRLTNEMRSRIAKAVLEHRFGPEEKEIELDRKKLGSLVYDTLYDKFTQGLMAELPEGWLPTQCADHVYFAGQWVSVEFGEPRRFLYEEFNTSPKFGADDPVSKLFESIESRKYKLREARGEASAKVNGLLSEATTVKKLLEIWPEVEPFIPPATAPVHLPAVPRAEVNALLGLPTRKEEL